MSEFFTQLEKLLAALADPEYQFLVLEPLIFWLVAAGVVIFGYAYFAKKERLLIVSLSLVLAGALVFLPYLGARKASSQRIEQVYRANDLSRSKSFVENTRQREEQRWLYLLLAGVAAGAILVGPTRNRLGLTLGIASVALGLYTMERSLWMNYQDALAFHPNLKSHGNGSGSGSGPSPARKPRPADPPEAPKATPSTKPAPSVKPIPVAKPVAVEQNDGPRLREIRPLP